MCSHSWTPSVKVESPSSVTRASRLVSGSEHVLLDISLPEMDGTDVLRIMREDPALRERLDELRELLTAEARA